MAHNSPTPSASPSTAVPSTPATLPMRMLGHPARWIEALIALRNLLVAPLGLKSSGAGDKGRFGRSRQRPW